MVASPVLYLLFIAAMARLTSYDGRTPIPDSPGYKARIEAYVPFVQAVRHAKTESAQPGTPEFAAALQRIVVEASAPLPTVEATRIGACSSADIRYPIYAAKQAALTLVWKHYHAARAAGNHQEALRAAIWLLLLSNVQRYADCQAIVASTSAQSAAVAAIRHHIHAVDEQTLRRAYDLLVSLESTRGSVEAPMRVDMHLLTARLATKGHSSEAIAVSELLASALDAARRGECSLRNLELWGIPETSNLRDAVRTTVLTWDLALRHEDASQRVIRSLVVDIYNRLRSRFAASEELAPLPTFILAATARGFHPELKRNGRGFRLVYPDVPAGHAPSVVVATR